MIAFTQAFLVYIMTLLLPKKRKWFFWALWIVLAQMQLFLFGCLDSAPKGSLELSVHGPPYPRARCTKGPAAMGKIRPQGVAVAGARVVLEPGEYTGTTDGEGLLTIDNIPRGSYTLTISSPAYLSPKGQMVTIASAKTTTLDITLSPCVIVVGDYDRVGFDKTIKMTAWYQCGDAWKDASYTWTQVEGPDVRSSVKSWTEQQLRFKTRSLEDVREIPESARVLSFSPDEAGQYVFQVSGKNKQGTIAQDYVLVTSTNVAGSTNSVPPYTDVYMVTDKTLPAKWEIKTWPTGWPKTLEKVTDRVARIRITPNNYLSALYEIEVLEKTNGYQFKIWIGNWDMTPRDCGTTGCHPPIQQAWEKTRHGMTWQKLVDGELKGARGPSVESCATCHALGYNPSPTIKNNGYDDVVDLYDVTFPTNPTKGTYEKLNQSIKEVSNVYCLACHGPARVDPPFSEQPGRFEVGVCARCHDRLPEQDLVSQWRSSGMSQTIKEDLNGPEAKTECAFCHTSQGFYYKYFPLARPPSSETASLDCCLNTAPITCQTCHSPMYATNKAQLFQYGWVKTQSGLDLKNVGSGAICVMCHNTNHDSSVAKSLQERLAPHSPQADLGYGKAGFVLPAEGYAIPEGAACFKTAGDSCVTCHMDEGPTYGQPGYRQVGDHTFRMISNGGVKNTRTCQICHSGMQSFDPIARHDYDGDTKLESVRDEVDGLMVLAKTWLTSKIKERGFKGCDSKKSPAVWVKKGFKNKLVLVDALGFDLGDCDHSGAIERSEEPFVFSDADLLLHKAAYNVLLITEDKSRGLHNLPYTVILLQRTLIALTGGKGLPEWDPFKRKR